MVVLVKPCLASIVAMRGSGSSLTGLIGGEHAHFHVLPLSGIPRAFFFTRSKTHFGDILRCRIDSIGLGLGALTLFKQQNVHSTN